MNEIYLAAVCHDIKNNTLEATWLQKTETELKRVKCHSYSPAQKVDFLSDTGSDGAKYVIAAGWTDDFCAAYVAELERLAAEAAAIEQARQEAEAAAAAAAEKAAFDAEVARQAAIIKAAQELAAQN